MSLVFYATIVAGFLVNFGATSPVAQFSPTLTCPATYYLVNNVCIKIPTEVQPCSTAPCQAAACPTTSCQTAACPTTSCQTAACPTTSCQTAACSTTSCQTAACLTTSCQTAITTTQQCSTATSCSTCQPNLNCQRTGAVCCQQGTCPEPCNQPNQPCCSTANIIPNIIQLPPPPAPTPTTTPTPTPTPSPSPPPTPTPPRPPKQCPPGTILINDRCSLVYCDKGIYRNGKCIITVCPDGTVWTGSMCKAPLPQEPATFTITNTIHTNVNRTNDNHQMNYTNNITIHITEIPDHETVTISPTPYPETITKSPTNCCIIVTPTACTWDGYRHNCRNRRYRQCGSICTSKYIYLIPPKVQVVPPPPIPTCMDNSCGYDNTPFYPDCSTCEDSIEERCMTYCRRSTCQTRQCQEVDMRGYCDSYRGSIGCRRMDGCIQDWCA